MSHTGIIYVLSAPSGAGKTSLVNRLVTIVPNLCISVSYTTRPRRPEEVDGVNYHFIDIETFKSMIERNEFMEYAEVFGNYYGTSAKKLQDDLAKGLDVILEIDWQGSRQVQALFPDCESIFILPPSREALLHRLRNRGQDSEKVIAQRMSKAAAEISHHKEYHHIVVNEDFEVALRDLEAIVLSNRLKSKRQIVKYSQLLRELLI